MTARARRILWVDGVAGLLVGVVVLALHRWLAGLYGFPVDLVLFVAALAALERRVVRPQAT